VDEIVTGRRREGAFAGVMTFVRKATQAAAVMGVGFVLQWGGFVSGSTTQTENAVETIVRVMSVITLIVLAAGFLVSRRFRLDRNTHAILMQEIERFKQQPGTDAPAEHRRVVEDLSGWPYEKLWGRNPVASRGTSPLPASGMAMSATPQRRE
jgi:oligogalacturonide transporter